MRTLVHLSDLHFGRIDHAILRPLIETVQGLKPDLVAVSGDLTQRARSTQFREARAFLDALPGPQIVVPGNHDVPLYNLFARFLRPLSKYQRYITDDLEPFYADAQIAILESRAHHAVDEEPKGPVDRLGGHLRIQIGTVRMRAHVARQA